MALRLTVEEQGLFDLLRCAAEQLSQQKSSQEENPVHVRVVGGWVRDKLMSRDSHDIDIAVDAVEPEDFATKVRSLSDDAHSGRIAVLVRSEADVRPSTVHVRCNGIDVDVVRLQGTPYDDARRRDLTVNALFYNINTSLVEDWTGQGITDLAAGLLRGPLPDGLASLAGDWNRATRIIRFASRFRFHVHVALQEALRTETLRRQLLEKRIPMTSELFTMLRDAVSVEQQQLAEQWHADHSLVDYREGVDCSRRDVCFAHLLHEFGLFSLVLAVPSGYPQIEQQAADLAFHCAMCLRLPQFAVFSAWLRQCTLLTCLLLPFHHIACSFRHKHAQSPEKCIVLTGLRASVEKARDVHAFSVASVVLFEAYCQQDNRALFHAACLSLRDLLLPEQLPLVVLLVACLTVNQPQHEGSLQYALRQADEYVLHNDYATVAWQPDLFKGDALRVALKLKGLSISAAIRQMRIWQLENPTGTADDCLLALTRQFMQY
eukprot:TRINITY_DN13511_c0_g1_i1.p1 TRINITY_DN13511_c0_g1~~TRINITY_DN13511_c0_g1_i1.p1  ORF type:complete len:490 (+),score=102.38 TRINITY_DN13511_c0_g1_i1:33-1502(+)